MNELPGAETRSEGCGPLVYARMVAIAAVLDETGRLAAAMICGELETGEEQALAELAGESLERDSAINH